METTVIENQHGPLGDLLAEELNTADAFYAASAFLNSGGLGIIEPSLRRILEQEGEVSIVHGADFRVTDPDAVRSLAALKMRYGTMSYFVHCDWSLLARQAFHPKLYITTADYRRYCAIVGSSNLTLGGLRSNVEVNAVIRGDDSEEPVRRCLDIFDSILASTALVEPDLEFAEKYAHLHERAGDLPLTCGAPVGPGAALRRPSRSLAQRTKDGRCVAAYADRLRGPSDCEPHGRGCGGVRASQQPSTPRLNVSPAPPRVAYDWATFDNSVQGPTEREHSRTRRPGPLRAPGRAVRSVGRISAFTQGTGLRRTTPVTPVSSTERSGSRSAPTFAAPSEPLEALALRFAALG